MSITIIEKIITDSIDNNGKSTHSSQRNVLNFFLFCPCRVIEEKPQTNENFEKKIENEFLTDQCGG